MKTLRLILIIVLGITSFVSCRKDALDEGVRNAIQNDISTFVSGAIPLTLLDAFSDSDILIFGETHYVQEHQEFIVNLLPELNANGYRVIFDELFHCFSWMVDDYVNARIDHLPEFILYFNETLVEGIKSFNATVADSLKFHFAYMDANQWKSNFLAAIEEIEKITGPQNLFTAIKTKTVDSDAYQTELRNMQNQLVTDSVQYANTLGYQWYDRIREILDVELESSEYRNSRNDQDREWLMYQNIERTFLKYPEAKAVVNTGMFHGQKTTLMGMPIERIGQLLNNASPGVYSIAFVGMKGHTKLKFDDTANIAFDLGRGASGDNIIVLLGDLAGSQMSFLPLSNTVFAQQDIRMTYSYGTTIKVPIGIQFDAILTYPEISTLKSMDSHDWH